MRVVIQRVNKAQVAIDNEVVGKIKRGFLLLVGLRDGDELEQVKKANEELNGDIKEELQKLKSSNIEIIDYINIITSEK